MFKSVTKGSEIWQQFGPNYLPVKIFMKQFLLQNLYESLFSDLVYAATNWFWIFSGLLTNTKPMHVCQFCLFFQKGNEVIGTSDLGMADTLCHFMTGGHKRPLVISTLPFCTKFQEKAYCCENVVWSIDCILMSIGWLLLTFSSKGQGLSAGLRMNIFSNLFYNHFLVLFDINKMSACLFFIF